MAPTSDFMPSHVMKLTRSRAGGQREQDQEQEQQQPPPQQQPQQPSSPPAAGEQQASVAAGAAGSWVTLVSGGNTNTNTNTKTNTTNDNNNDNGNEDSNSNSDRRRSSDPTTTNNNNTTTTTTHQPRHRPHRPTRTQQEAIRSSPIAVPGKQPAIDLVRRYETTQIPGPFGEMVEHREWKVFVPWQIRPGVAKHEWRSHPEWQRQELEEMEACRRRMRRMGWRES